MDTAGVKGLSRANPDDDPVAAHLRAGRGVARACLVGRALGRAVRVEHLDHDTFRGLLRSGGLPDARVAAIAGMSDGLSRGYEPAERREVRTTTPTTLAAWLATRSDVIEA